MEKLSYEQMDNYLRYEALTNYIKKEIRLDINRLWQYCEESIKTLSAENTLLLGENKPAGMNEEEIKHNIDINIGRMHAFQDIKNLLELRY